MLVLSIAYSCSDPHAAATAFAGIETHRPAAARSPSFPSSLTATREDQETGTWSRPGSDAGGGAGARTGSRFGLRRRVKAVLKKAKKRTGIDNLNTSVGSVVAEAASIGGFDADEPDFVFRNPPPTKGDAVGAGSAKRNGSSRPFPSPLMRNDTETSQLALLSRGSSETGQTTTTTTNDAAPLQGAHGDDVDVLLNSDEVSIDPLPFTLPTLSAEQKALLVQGERIEMQEKMGREGSGFVVLDVKAPPYVVWECLLDFEAYPEYIGTVKSMQMFTNTHLKSSYVAEKPVLPGTGRETRHYGTSSVTRASFVLSKFQLKIAAIHKYFPHPDGHYMEFSLDRACTNFVLKDAKGIWYTQTNPDGRGEDYTRVWLLCDLKVSRVLPTFIVDYAAKRAMPRATTWLRPLVEEKSAQWLVPNGGR